MRPAATSFSLSPVQNPTTPAHTHTIITHSLTHSLTHRTLCDHITQNTSSQKKNQHHNNNNKKKKEISRKKEKKKGGRKGRNECSGKDRGCTDAV